MARISLARHFSDQSDGGESGGAGGGTSDTTPDTSATDTSKANDDKQNSDAEAALGDAGKKALKEERDARRDAERRARAAEGELESLRTANQTEQEKALSTARKEAATEERSKWEGLIRRTRVESALTAAGCIDPALASLAPEFHDLKVNDTGSVDGLDEVIETFKAGHPRQFAAMAPGGSADQGIKPNNNEKRPASLDEAIAAHFSAQGR